MKGCLSEEPEKMTWKERKKRGWVGKGWGGEQRGAMGRERIGVKRRERVELLVVVTRS